MSELYHFGIKGQKWGIRRYQNEDGSLTDAGQQRYARREARVANRIRKYKEQESAVQEKRYGKMINKEEKKASKYAEKAKKYSSLNKVKKAEKYTNKAKDAEATARLGKEFLKKELHAIKRLNRYDITHEKAENFVQNLFGGLVTPSFRVATTSRLDPDEFERFDTIGTRRKK